VLRPPRHLLTVFSLNHEDDPRRFVDEDGVDTLIACTATKGRRRAGFGLGDEGTEKPEDEELVVAELWIAIAELTEFTAQIGL
jgi:hypothetical protein